MALPPTIHRATIELSDLDRGLYGTLETTVARHPSETGERLVLRLLAFALWFSDELEFTRGISAGDEPDLWTRSPDGRTELWIEVGLPDADRLLKAARHCAHTALLASGPGNAWRSWRDRHWSRLQSLNHLDALALTGGLSRPWPPVCPGRSTGN